MAALMKTLCGETRGDVNEEETSWSAVHGASGGEEAEEAEGRRAPEWYSSETEERLL